MKTEKRVLLAVDIGNSTIGLGFYRDPCCGGTLEVENIDRKDIGSSSNLARLISRFLGGKMKKPEGRPVDAVISSVVPSLNSAVSDALAAICIKPLVVDHKTIKGIKLEVSRPETIGADRILNALAGYNRFEKPAAVVDFGTATTITVVGKQARLIGGAILPGLGMMRDSLASRTAKLPLITLSAPAAMLGKGTEAAIVSGIINGTVGAVENIVRGIEKEIHVKLHLILTGGHAGLVSPLMHKRHVSIPNLIFEGMRLFYNEET